MPEQNLISRTFEELQAGGREITRLFTGNPLSEGFIFPPQIIRRGMDTFMDKAGYEPLPEGLPEARESIAAYYCESGIKTGSDDIFISSGTSESYRHIFSLLCEPGDNILMPNPSYPLFEHIAADCRIESRQYLGREDWQADLDDLRSKIDSRTRAVVIISPHNPTGNVISDDIMAELAKICSEHDLALIFDEVFAEFFWQEGIFPRPAACEGFPLVFTLNGVSKMFALPWLKIGWIMLSGEDRIQIRTAGEKLSLLLDTYLSANYSAQVMLPGIFQEGKEFITAMVQAVREQKELACGLLKETDAAEFASPAGGYYMTLKTRIRDEEAFTVSLMKERGIYIYPGYFYDIQEDGHFVISFLMRKERLEPALHSLVEHLENYK